MSLRVVNDSIKQVEKYVNEEHDDYSKCIYALEDIFETLLNLSLNREFKNFKSTGSTISDFYTYAAYTMTKVDPIVITDVICMCSSWDNGEVNIISNDYVLRCLSQAKTMYDEVSQQFNPEIANNSARYVTLADLINSLNVGESRAVLCSLGDLLITDALSNYEAFQGVLHWTGKDSTGSYTGTILCHQYNRVACVNLTTDDPSKYYVVTVYRAE